MSRKPVEVSPAINHFVEAGLKKKDGEEGGDEQLQNEERARRSVESGHGPILARRERRHARNRRWQFGLARQGTMEIIGLRRIPAGCGCSSVVEHLLAKEDVASSSLVTRSSLRFERSESEGYILATRSGPTLPLGCDQAHHPTATLIEPSYHSKVDGH